MSPRDAAAHMADRATLSIRELKFSGAGRWLMAALLVLGGAGGGAVGVYGLLGIGPAQPNISVSDVTEVAGAIRQDLREFQTEQRDQGRQLGALLERVARIEAYVEELRRVKK